MEGLKIIRIGKYVFFRCYLGHLVTFNINGKCPVCHDRYKIAMIVEKALEKASRKAQGEI